MRTPTARRATADREERGERGPNGALLSAALVALLILVLLAPLMTFDTGPLTGGGNTVRQILYLLTLGVAVVAVRPLDDPKRILTVPWPLVAVLAYCALSLTWAIAPGVGARRLFLTALVIWTLCIIAANLPYRRLLTVIRIVSIVALVANYLTVLLLPDVGIHHANDSFDKDLIGAWRGFMEQKNYAGAFCAITFVMFAFDTKEWPRWVAPLVIAGASFFLFMAESKTSFGIGLYAIAGGMVYLMLPAKYRTLFLPVLFAAGLALLTVLAIFKRPLEAEFSDPRAFTNRTQIWQMLVSYWQDHRWTGAGYGSFWNIGDSSPVYRYGRGFVTSVTSGHSGFLDLLASIGLPGLILVVLAAVVYPLVKLLLDTRMERQKGALLTALVLFCIGHNSTETSLFDRDQTVHVFLMLAIVLIARAGRSGGGSGEPAAPRNDADRLWSDLGMRQART